MAVRRYGAVFLVVDDFVGAEQDRLVGASNLGSSDVMPSGEDHGGQKRNNSEPHRP
jgi:hypothetical protein